MMPAKCLLLDAATEVELEGTIVSIVDISRLAIISDCVEGSLPDAIVFGVGKGTSELRDVRSDEIAGGLSGDDCCTVV